MQAVIAAMASCSYEWGAPARGVLRSYFREPTLFEQRTADAEVATTYALKTSTGEMVRFRPDPSRYQKHELLPPRLTSDADPADYPRDMVCEFALPISITTVAFTVGAWVVGQTSRAFARIEDISITGVLSLSEVAGTFSIGETVIDDDGGTGVVASPGLFQESSILFKDAIRPSIFSAGITDGDFITVHEEVLSITGSKLKQLVVSPPPARSR